MQLPGRPRIVVTDDNGDAVPPERWTDEQRLQYFRQKTEQFGAGEQLATIQEIRDEATLRFSCIESWEENQAVQGWLLRQLDGIIAGAQGVPE